VARALLVPALVVPGPVVPVLLMAALAASCAAPPPVLPAASPRVAPPAVPVVVASSVVVASADVPLPEVPPEPSLAAPLVAASGVPFMELPIADHEAAVVSLPLGATGPRPVLVATHGAGGRATTHCRIWRAIVGDRGFVLCPRGRSMYPALSHARQSGYYYPGHPALDIELAAALDALVTRFPDHVDRTAPIFAGYSQGAGMGALILPGHAARFARAAFIEGGVGQHQEWNLATAQRFADRGGERVLLVCGRSDCHRFAQTTARHLERVGLGARVVYAPGAGHRYDGQVQRLVAESFPWLVAGDARWGEVEGERPVLGRVEPYGDRAR
jgi:predicted esterase